ncbi:hypothetical protein BTJ44_04753 [Bacillus mycoides]|nr:hypothetical protein BTJ44_04753 [Bacillus mycoides]
MLASPFANLLAHFYKNYIMLHKVGIRFDQSFFKMDSFLSLINIQMLQ